MPHPTDIRKNCNTKDREAMFSLSSYIHSVIEKFMSDLNETVFDSRAQEWLAVSVRDVRSL